MITTIPGDSCDSLRLLSFPAITIIPCGSYTIIPCNSHHCRWLLLMDCYFKMDDIIPRSAWQLIRPLVTSKNHTNGQSFCLHIKCLTGLTDFWWWKSLIDRWWRQSAKSPDDTIVNDMERLSFQVPSEKRCTYVVCNTSQRLDRLRNHFISLTARSGKIPILVDCEGRELGRTDGKLGLVQLGIEDEIYLLDIVEIVESLDVSWKWSWSTKLLKQFCGMIEAIILNFGMDTELTWTLRLIYNLFISMNPQMDGDEVFPDLTGWERYIPLWMGPPPSMQEIIPGIYGGWQTTVQDAVEEKHKQNDTEFWISRPLDPPYSSFWCCTAPGDLQNLLLGSSNVPRHQRRVETICSVVERTATDTGCMVCWSRHPTAGNPRTAGFNAN